MKKNSNRLFNEIGTKQMDELTIVVPETLAPRCYQPKPKIFTAADLWHIQRQYNRRSQRRIFI
ncbi:MAG: hypothetical protein JWP81_1345 [Ferruginibacter sp.]|nr:hypothetical protein [Ferruginibacter sp.]